MIAKFYWKDLELPAIEVNDYYLVKKEPLYTLRLKYKNEETLIDIYDLRLSEDGTKIVINRCMYVEVDEDEKNKFLQFVYNEKGNS